MTKLQTIPADAWPALGGWVDPTVVSSKQIALLVRGMADIGTIETPLGSNRGVRIDRYVKRGGGKLGSYWCAFWVGAVYADCGLKVPPGYGACDAWLPWLDVARIPQIGDLALYGPSAADAQHIEMVGRVSPELLTIGGNRGLLGGKTRNGVAVQMDKISRGDLLGYAPWEAFA